jgi:hypothetical protein
MEDELWLEYDGIPLKWNIPIGVLFDLLCSSSSSSSSNDNDSSINSSKNHIFSLPWRIIVHFQQFPTQKLLRCKSLNTVRQHYLNTIKESLYIRFNSTKIASICTPADHQRLWDSLIHLRHDAHAAIWTKIINQGIGGAPLSHNNDNPNQFLQSLIENRSVESLAIRLYIHCTRPNHEEGALADTHCSPIQKTISPRAKDGKF